MKSLAEQLAAYQAYHQDGRNKLTHFVGVPLVTFSIFLFLGWLRCELPLRHPKAARSASRDLRWAGSTLFQRKRTLAAERHSRAEVFRGVQAAVRWWFAVRG